MTHLSLCSGIGGLDLAAEWAGFETVAQCEIDTYASKVLQKNFPGVPNLHDIRTVTNERLAELGIRTPTVISAGFPCQPYSLAGKGLGDRDDRDLWGEVARVLREIRPRWFVGENTPGLFARSNQRYFRRVLDDLAALGYSVGWGIWGACDVGAPHKRQRVFMLGWNPNSEHEKKKQKLYEKNLEPSRDSRAISNTNSEQARRLFIGKEKTYTEFRFLRGNVPNADGFREQQQKKSKQEIRKWSCDCSWWETEPDVGRVANGVSARVDRLRCLGNAVVPQQAYPIFKAIAEFEEGKDD